MGMMKIRGFVGLISVLAATSCALGEDPAAPCDDADHIGVSVAAIVWVCDGTCNDGTWVSGRGTGSTEQEVKQSAWGAVAMICATAQHRGIATFGPCRETL